MHFGKSETSNAAGKLLPGRGRWQTIAIIMSNVSYLTLTFTQKYQEPRGTQEENECHKERERQVRVSLYLQRWTKKESILKSDASESDRLTFAFQCDWLWREEIGS